MAKRDYYLVLGVSPNESVPGIRAAFRDLVRRYHPDRAGPDGTRFYREIVEAYAVLSDDEQRAAYDRGLDHSAQRRPPRGDVVVTPGPEWARGRGEPLVPTGLGVLDGVEVMRPSFDELLQRFLTEFVRPEPRLGVPVEALRMQVVLSRAQALRGGLLTLGVPVFYPCPRCRGTGFYGTFPCGRCSGGGMAEEEEEVRVDIPPLVTDGAIMELPLRGLGIQHMVLQLRVRVAD
ncbi:MAG: J domain-containing protein [Deltaproteobacteria bacterium]|jgi:hypothetical protein|nr:J domain-containing protein [Deltaproteobacteria bacterium]MBW2534796.1 J domain-containing protein [Deltaproteobacteria bacterium]